MFLRVLRMLGMSLPIYITTAGLKSAIRKNIVFHLGWPNVS